MDELRDVIRDNPLFTSNPTSAASKPQSVARWRVSHN